MPASPPGRLLRRPARRKSSSCETPLLTPVSTDVELDATLVPLLPAQQAFAPVEPRILLHHEARTRQLIGKCRHRELDQPAQHEAAQRPQLAAGQRIVEKAQRRRKKPGIEDDLPPRPPGEGHSVA